MPCQNITHRTIEICLFWLYTFSNIIWYNLMGPIIKFYTTIKIKNRIIKIMKKVSIRTESKKVFKDLQILPVPCIYILESMFHSPEQNFL